jgi:hypothetical protein
MKIKSKRSTQQTQWRRQNEDGGIVVILSTGWGGVFKHKGFIQVEAKIGVGSNLINEAGYLASWI